jgi:methionyl-tRNA formyltransferase
VVVGAGNPHLEEIARLCEAMPQAALHRQISNMAELMANADLAMGAGGSATWERCCVGLPSLVWCIAENQMAIAKGAAELGLCMNLGAAGAVSVRQVSHVLSDLLNDAAGVLHASGRCQLAVDGKGASRVASLVAGSLRLSIVSDKASWLNQYIPELVACWRGMGHPVCWVHDVRDVEPGDCAFFLGCGQLAGRDVLSRNVHNLVVHESALPHGKGWSPLTWQILEGKSEIPITLFEAALSVDSGEIYLTDTMPFDGSELVEGLRVVQAEKTVSLCKKFVSGYPEIVGNAKPQQGEPTFYARRTQAHSELDPDKTIREQFNLLRVVDNKRYPAFFKLNGKTYLLKIELADELRNCS